MNAETSGSVAEVFRVFLKLGLTSFGGPIAHLAYYREELVVRRKWLDDAAYADLVALCQFLPGPSSSQVGFSLGMMRAGWGGAIAASIAFTLPSALLLLLLAMTATGLDTPIGAGLVHGLKIVAVAIIAHAVWGMAQSLCPDRERGAIAAGAVALLAILPGSIGMIGVILAGILAGLALGRGKGGNGDRLHLPVSRRAGLAALGLFILLLVMLPMLREIHHGFVLVDSFYRAGSLVFGGGHVVLPLLQAELVEPGWIGEDAFLAGYAATQAVPGPLFTFAVWLGASMEPQPNGISGALIAILTLFLPGYLILIAALPFWNRLRQSPAAQSAMQGANAAVVGILGMALYSPVFTSAIRSGPDLAVALVLLVLLAQWKAPSWSIVLLGAAFGVGLALL